MRVYKAVGRRERDGEFSGHLVADYLAEAERADAPPLASCPVDRYLDAVA